MASEKVRFFPTPAHLREWFATNHETATELWAGFYKKETGKPSITWPESVDEALCCGWIDGIRKSLDESSYTIRFTPRKRRASGAPSTSRGWQRFSGKGGCCRPG